MEPNLARLLDIPVRVDASLEGPTLCIGELLALRVGSVIATSRPAGENVDVYAGDACIGSGELDVAGKRTIIHMLKFND